MAFEMPEGVEVDMESAFSSDTPSSEGSSTTAPRDYHQEAYPAYVPPNRRGHNVQEGDEFVNFKNRDPKKGPDPDKVMGAENDKYQRLKVRTNFALTKQDRDLLVPDFPGIYFHSADNTNHDHPKSHVVTQIGTRFTQRKIAAGSRILGVYDSPYACERFNASQAHAANPKSMHALVYNFGHTDYIREVNKWGPIEGPDGDRYLYGQLKQVVADNTIADYNVLQFIHTLYYVDFNDLNDALHAPSKHGKRTAMALIHRHEGSSGTINYGEQSFTKKGNLVKQVNKLTNSSYVHPDLTPILFAEKKYWYPQEEMAFANGRLGKRVVNDGRKGFTWDVIMVNRDTWIVQIVPCTRPDDQDDGLNDTVDYEELWDELEEIELLDKQPIRPTGPQRKDRKMVIPMSDGRFIELDLCSDPLLSKLRVSCVGKRRDSKLVAELVNQARHLVDPSTLFGSSQGIHCPEDKIYDHVVGALFMDVCREKDVLAAAAEMGTLIRDHSKSLGMGREILSDKYATMLTHLRTMLIGARKVNNVLSARDAVDAGLGALQSSLGFD